MSACGYRRCRSDAEFQVTDRTHGGDSFDELACGAHLAARVKQASVVPPYGVTVALVNDDDDE